MDWCVGEVLKKLNDLKIKSQEKQLKDFLPSAFNTLVKQMKLEGEKLEVVKTLKLKELVYFVNDKIKENTIIKKEFPKFKYILISPENPVSKINWQI